MKKVFAYGHFVVEKRWSVRRESNSRSQLGKLKMTKS